MKTVQCVVDTRCASNEVFAMLTDQSCDQNWMLGVVGTERLTPGEMRQGTQMICNFGVGCVTFMKADAVIDEFEPGHRFVRRRVGGALAMKGEFAVEPVISGSRVTWTMEVGLKMPLFAAFVDPFLALWMKMSMMVSLKQLKRLAESQRSVPVQELENVPYTS